MKFEEVMPDLRSGERVRHETTATGHWLCVNVYGVLCEYYHRGDGMEESVVANISGAVIFDDSWEVMPREEPVAQEVSGP